LVEIRLRQGLLGDVRVAWGAATIRGRPALLVASEDNTTGRKVSIQFEKER